MTALSRGGEGAAEGRSEQVKDVGRRAALRLWRMLNGQSTPLKALALYALLTLLVTFPVGFRLSSHVAGEPLDAFEHLWSLWWGKKAMLELGVSMADVSHFYHPQGAQIPILAVTPLVQLAALPLTLLFKPVVVYNLTFLLSFIITAFTTYLLCYEVSGNRLAAFVGGVVFGFAPTRSLHGLGHLAQITTYFFPLYGLTVVRMMRDPSKRNGIWAGILLGVSALVNFVHTTYFVLPFTGCWLLFFLRKRREFSSMQTLRSVGLMILVAGVLVLPFFVPFVFAQLSSGTEYMREPGVVAFSANPLSFVLPSPWHPVLRRLGMEWLIRELLGNFVENLAYIGVIPLALSVLAVRKQGRGAKLWVGFAVLTAVLALGPVLKIGRTALTINVEGRTVYLPLPYLLLYVLPFLGMGRTPARITTGTAMALAVTASLGMAAVVTWIRQHRPWAEWPTAVLMVALILFEYCAVFPYPTTPVEVPDFYHQVRDEEGQFAVFDYPVSRGLPTTFHEFGRPMFYQTIHGRPIAGGKIWRLPPEGKKMVVLLGELVAPQQSSQAEILSMDRTPDERISVLSAMDFGYLVLHKYSPKNLSPKGGRDLEVVNAERDWFRSWLGDPVYEDQWIMAFRVPDDYGATGAPLTAIGDGWHAVEGDAPRRWLGEEGRVDVYSTVRASYRLEFTAYSYEEPRQISLFVNGEHLYTTKVHLEREFVTPAFYLQPGLNDVVFRAESCARPQDLNPESKDSRCLGVSFSGMDWVKDETKDGIQQARARFGDHFRLVGYRLDESEVQPGDQVKLALYWEVLRPIDRDYTVFTHLVGEHQQLGGQRDNPPVEGTYPTTWLGAGEIVKDDYEIPIWDDAAPGVYTLRVGWYHWITGERLPLRRGATADGETYVSLAEIEVVRKE